MTLVPKQLRDQGRWLTWKHLSGRKPPCDAEGRAVDGNDPGAWTSYDVAVQVFAEAEPVDGVGFAVGGGLTMVDCDHCRDPKTGQLDPRAAGLVRATPGAYVEVSPSGEGIKLFGRGENGDGEGRWLELDFRERPAKITWHKSGYGTVTGDVLDPALDPDRELPVLRLDALAGAIGGSAGASLAGAPSTPGVRDRPRREKPLPADGGAVRPGGQESAIFRELSALRGRGLSEAAAVAAIWAEVQGGRFPNEKGREPWTRADVEAKARSVWARYEGGTAAEHGGDFEPDQLRSALYFVDSQGDRWRYDHRRGRWLAWDEVRWAPDQDEAVLRAISDMVLDQIERAVSRGDKIGKLGSLTGRNALASIRDIARTRKPVASVGDEWDTDPWLLGVPNGVVDLRTGTLRAATPEDRITMQAAAAYDPEARAPLWEKTVSEVFARDPDIIPYVHRALGYSLTGDVRHEVFFLATSALDAERPGREGKGTLINTVSAVLGDYAATLAFHSLEGRKEEGGATPDLAKLVHKRFVTASETSGGRFNTARIKSVTGRDPIAARFLYKDEFTYVPEFKIWLLVNRPPRVGDDEAFWSRPHRIPFRTSFRGREDTTLKDRLLAEREGILAWLVRGCLAWQKAGPSLQAPEVVTQATEEYRESESPLAEFLSACCVLQAGAWTPYADLRAAYVRWCERERVRFVLGGKRFAKEVAMRFRLEKETNGSRRTGYFGVGLAATPGQEREPGDDSDAPF